jgi:hypothetical protein
MKFLNFSSKITHSTVHNKNNNNTVVVVVVVYKKGSGICTPLFGYLHTPVWVFAHPQRVKDKLFSFYTTLYANYYWH